MKLKLAVIEGNNKGIARTFEEGKFSMSFLKFDENVKYKFSWKSEVKR